ncbi:MAG: arginine--tRNA ligase [Thermoplasmata archaeon]|nr:arginine--tRNA ligase [Thermoplasmata archaeon]
MPTTVASLPAEVTDPWDLLLDPLLDALLPRLEQLHASVDRAWLAAQLDLSASSGHDIALPLHRPASQAGAAPDLFARSVADGLPLPIGLHAVEATGPYVNFSTDPVWLADVTLGLVARRGASYGRSDRPRPAACVEHTSANPTGPLHVGRIRNGLIGDTLAKVLRAAGSPVTTQYYVDDLGRQAAMITWIWSKPVTEWPEEARASLAGSESASPTDESGDVHFGRPYPAVSAFLKTHPEAAREVAQINESLESGVAPPRHREIAQSILDGMLASLGRIGVTFDELVWESTFLNDGSVAAVLKRLGHAPHALREENGALAIDASTYGLPKKTAHLIVTRANGTSLYAARDIAYHLAKFARFPRVIDVLGQDHRLHARTLEVLLTELGETRRPEFVIYQDLTVPEGGRMSTRKGTAISLDDLLDEAEARARLEVRARWPEVSDAEVASIAQAIAAGAIRYHIVRVAPDKTVAFRWEEALSFEGRSGPFVQYSFVRATSLLRKAEGTTPPFAFAGAELGKEPERALLRTISRLPSRIQYAAASGHVHALAGYAHDLAEAFNRFYQSVPVLTAGAERSSRLALVAAARDTLGITLDLLGLPRLERM